MLSAISYQLSAKAKSVSVKKAESASLKTESLSQKGFSPLAILILVVLGVFIIWEITLTIENPFSTGVAQNVTSSQATPACNFPDPNDPCDLDSGAGFNL